MLMVAVAFPAHALALLEMDKGTRWITNRLNLTTLEERRWRGDMIQTWRILSGKDMVEAYTWFELEADRPRQGATRTRNALGHHAIRPREYRERGEFFTNRVVRSYNLLPDTVK